MSQMKVVSSPGTWARPEEMTEFAASLCAPCWLRRNNQDRNPAEKLHLCSEDNAQLP